MNVIAEFIMRHGYGVLFGALFAHQVGLPVPVPCICLRRNCHDRARQTQAARRRHSRAARSQPRYCSSGTTCVVCILFCQGKVASSWRSGTGALRSFL